MKLHTCLLLNVSYSIHWRIHTVHLKIKSCLLHLIYMDQCFHIYLLKIMPQNICDI